MDIEEPTTLPENDHHIGIHDMATRFLCKCGRDGISIIVRLGRHAGNRNAGMVMIDLYSDGTFSVDTNMIDCEWCKKKFDDFLLAIPAPVLENKSTT